MTTSVERPSRPLSDQLNTIAVVAMALLGLVGLYSFRHANHLSRWDIWGLVGLGTIGICRWTWFIIRVVRSRIYLRWVFPHWRRRAEQVPITDFPPICFLVPTYKEQPWITERVFRAIVQEARSLAHPITLLVNSSGEAENATIRTVLETADPDYGNYIRLIEMTQKDGKRQAMADALRHLATLNLPADSIIALMDGDSELAPGTLRQCLPFFRLFPRMGALTTDEMPIVKGSQLFSEWFHLRFAQRHYQMCSDSLSRKVMCLTGRFSLFRAEAALQPSFATQLENDTLDDWLWGRFKFLSGDDKSTWFWLLRRQYDMFYIPDAIVYSIETVNGSVVDRAYQNMRRWYGNMLRNNGRAIELGPQSIGWFTWFSLVDQRVSIWTSLLTPGFLLISVIQGNWHAVALVLSWVLFSRTMMLSVIFRGRESELKPVHFPLLLMAQWSSSLVKIWTQMNLAKQNWSNRGNQSISAEGTGSKRMIRLGTSRLLLFCQLFGFSLLLCWLSGVLNPAWDLAGLWLNHQVAQQPQVQIIDAATNGLVANDSRDDAAVLQALIDRAPTDRPVQIQLPIGEIDLFQPIQINRSDLTLQGHGVARTVLQSHLDASLQSALLVVRPHTTQLVGQRTTPGSPIAAELSHVQISGFSVRPAPDLPTAQLSQVDGILLEDVAESSVKHLSFEQESRHALVLNRTRNIAIEYVNVGDHQRPGAIVLRNAQNTQTRGFSLPAATS